MLMFTEKQLENYAEVLLWGLNIARKKKFRKNDTVIIRYDLPALRLTEILYDKILEKGQIPIPRINPTPCMEKSFFTKANGRQLSFKTPGDEELYRNLSGGIYLIAPESVTHLRSVEPYRIGKASVARKYLREILDRREEQGDFGWTLCACPTQEQASHAKLSLEEYQEQIVKACFLDADNILEKWKNVRKTVTSLKKWLGSLSVRYFHIESENTDLKVYPGACRKWLGVSGRNIPSFEVFISPDWRKTEGIYFADQPSYRAGNYVENIKLVFSKGKVTEASAKKGEKFLKYQLNTDKGANRIGEFSLTDRRLSRIDKFMANTLFDENFGGQYGNCHIAMGSAYSDSFDGDTNDLSRQKKNSLGFNDSSLHWDLVNTENKRVTAQLSTGQKLCIYENGEFKQ